MIVSDDSDDCVDGEFILPDVTVKAKNVIESSLTDKSKDKYRATYDKFVAWQERKQLAISFDESVLLDYFEELAVKLKPSSLWAIHSMLKATLDYHERIDITKYKKLHDFVKKQSVGFHSTKSKVLTSEQVKKFLREAPDAVYLVTKVALIVGIYGACRAGELCRLRMKSIVDKGCVLYVNLPETKIHLPRSFVIGGEYYFIVKKYIDSRPKNSLTDRLFLKYHMGKCTQQPIGKNKFSSMPAQIAEYLNLPEPKNYTGHSFRSTSATILANTGADMILIKRSAAGKSDNLAEGCMNGSIQNNSQSDILSSSTIMKTEDFQIDESNPSSLYHQNNSHTPMDTEEDDVRDLADLWRKMKKALDQSTTRIEKQIAEAVKRIEKLENKEDNSGPSSEMVRDKILCESCMSEVTVKLEAYSP